MDLFKLKLKVLVLLVVTTFDIDNIYAETLCDSNALYRSADGSCNNLANPHYGMAGTVYQRLLPSHYSDGVEEFRISAVSNASLPSARLISTKVVTSDAQPNYDVSLFMMQWSQWIKRDLSNVLKPRRNDGQWINCCSGLQFGATAVQPPPHPECAPIEIPETDPVYNPVGAVSVNTCMNYVRTGYQFGYLEGNNSTDRQQINQNTHWLDGSQIYGSSPSAAMQLRNPTLGKGQLKTSKDSLGRTLLPFKDSSQKSCPISGQCFITGDDRSTENPLLTLTHTIWVREHNRVAKEIALLKPGKNDEYYYQEARRIVIAELQHITYTEYLPILIGEERTDRIMKAVPAEGNYFNQVNPNVYSEWVSGAGFAFHSMMRGFIRLYEPDLRLCNQSYSLGDSYNDVSKIFLPNFIDNALRGLLRTPVESVDSSFPEDVTSRSNKLWGQKLGLDLVASDIQAGRDQGLPSYLNALLRNQVNQLNGGNYFPITFDLLIPNTPPEVIASLRQVYDDVQDIDLFVGGISEIPEPGALLGPTFATIAAKQFDILKHGDRFFYDDPSQNVSFTPNQIMEIKKTSLSRIICDNSDGTVKTIQPNAFRTPKGWNKPVRCNKIPSINFAVLLGMVENSIERSDIKPTDVGGNSSVVKLPRRTSKAPRSGASSQQHTNFAAVISMAFFHGLTMYILHSIF